MNWQLRLYRTKPGRVADFAREWREHVLPLRRDAGFEVLGPWITSDDRFIWIVGHENLARADADYYASAERVALDPDPARHIADAEHVDMRDA